MPKTMDIRRGLLAIRKSSVATSGCEVHSRFLLSKSNVPPIKHVARSEAWRGLYGSDEHLTSFRRSGATTNIFVEQMEKSDTPWGVLI
jgi:hypothetical protein